MGIQIKGATSGSIKLDCPAAVNGGDISLTLPNGTGNADQVLQTNGSGTTSWAHLYGPSFRAHLNNSQVMSDGTWTTAILDDKDWDTDNCFNTSTGRFTPNKAGIYQITAHTYLNWSTGTPNRFGIRLAKSDGSTIGDVTTGAASYWGFAEITNLISFNGTTDWVEMKGYLLGATSGQTMLSGYTSMCGHYVRPNP